MNPKTFYTTVGVVSLGLLALLVGGVVLLITQPRKSPDTTTTTGATPSMPGATPTKTPVKLLQKESTPKIQVFTGPASAGSALTGPTPSRSVPSAGPNVWDSYEINFLNPIE